MYRCSSSHCNLVGSCTCGGVFHSQSNSFSMLFNHHRPFDEAEMYLFTPSSSSSCSSVDCTLSLGTPSTRLTNNDETEKRVHHDRRSGSRMSNFCWDILQQSKHTASPPPTHKAGRGSNTNNSGGGGGDPLLARRCANCDTTSTPLWRNGPRGPKSLCNACGIRFKKEERRASAATVSTSTYGGAGSGGGGVMEPPQHMMNNPWVIHQILGPVSFEHKDSESFAFISRRTSSFSSPVETATSWSLTMGATCAPVSSSSACCMCCFLFFFSCFDSVSPFALLRQSMFQGYCQRMRTQA